MTDPEGKARDAVRAAISELANTSPLDAFRRAGGFGQFLTDESVKLSRMRAAAALRVRDSEHMSLSELASLLGISKSRAAQLVRLASENDMGPDSATEPHGNRRQEWT
ncbi:MAG: hypothetical protein ACRCYU_10170 [Nocardioides sp.]